MVPLFIFGGLFFVCVLIGVVGLGIYHLTSRSVSSTLNQPVAMNNNPDPLAMVPPPNNQEPFANLPPGFDPFANMPPIPAMPLPPALPPMPLPPGMPNPGAGANSNTVTLSNARRVRGLGTRQELEVDYVYAAGQIRHPMDQFIVESNGQRFTVDLIGLGNGGTIRIRPIGLGGFNGPVTIWMERRNGFGPLGGAGPKISNTLTLP